MNIPRMTALTAGITLLVIATHVHAASIFPDVPDGHLFQEPIEELVRAGVVNGHPDGTFRPDDPVNRAAMLKMLYKAIGRLPDPLSKKCASDVEEGSWYESFVCDAWYRGDVNGYSDGTFRPADPVNRVEALKMIVTVFSLPLDEVTNDNREIVNFADVSLSAWYTQYLLTAYNRGVLPIAGETGPHFYPDRNLTRGEAAALIYNALSADLTVRRTETVSSSASSEQQDEQEEDNSDDASNSAASSAGQESSSDSSSSMHDASIPFSQEGKFTNKQATTYRFEVTGVQTLKVSTNLQSGQPGQLTCRLYLVEESGFSDEYFLGYQEDNACYITATLNPGTYQLQLQPTQSDTTYSVSVEEGTGDGNDGFQNARMLNLSDPRTDVLGAFDFEDWYRFSLQSEQTMMVVLPNPTELRCIIYAMSDVDLASFSGPQCNQNYAFPSGTYYISVGRKAPKEAQQTYTIELDK